MRGDNDESREVLGTIACLPAQLAWRGIGWVSVVHDQIVNRARFGQVARSAAPTDAGLAAITLGADDWQGNDVTHAAPDDWLRGRDLNP